MMLCFSFADLQDQTCPLEKKNIYRDSTRVCKRGKEEWDKAERSSVEGDFQRPMRGYSTCFGLCERVRDYKSIC